MNLALSTPSQKERLRTRLAMLRASNSSLEAILNDAYDDETILKKETRIQALQERYDTLLKEIAVKTQQIKGHRAQRVGSNPDHKVDIIGLQLEQIALLEASIADVNSELYQYNQTMSALSSRESKIQSIMPQHYYKIASSTSSEEIQSLCVSLASDVNQLTLSNSTGQQVRLNQTQSHQDKKQELLGMSQRLEELRKQCATDAADFDFQINSLSKEKDSLESQLVKLSVEYRDLIEAIETSQATQALLE